MENWYPHVPGEMITGLARAGLEKQEYHEGEIVNLGALIVPLPPPDYHQRCQQH